MSSPGHMHTVSILACQSLENNNNTQTNCQSISLLVNNNKQKKTTTHNKIKYVKNHKQIDM
jgi:hypothetical protein